MIFILGIVTGILISLVIVGIETYLFNRNRGIIKTVIERVETISNPKAKLMQPKEDIDLAREEKIQKNSDRGEGTPLADLDL